jgi:tetratricopeptide (TPR) repeat protein
LILRRLAVCCLLLLVPVVAIAAGDDFYQRIYDRGLAHYGFGNYAAACSELRIAAFGFVEDVARYESSEAYFALAAQHLGRLTDARDALQKILIADRVQPRFYTLTFPETVRAQLNAAVAALLTHEEAARFATLGNRPVATAELQKPTVVVPTPDVKPNVATTVDNRRGNVEGAAPPGEVATPPPPPRSAPPKPAPQPRANVPVPQPPRAAAVNVEATIGAAEMAVDAGELPHARSLYDGLLTSAQLTHVQALRIAEGLYRSRDFAGAVRAFDRVGTLGRGEEPFHYYHAVALFEIGRVADAKRELAAALPFIEQTPDVARYRAKITSAAE